MGITAKHKLILDLADSSAPGIVKPSNWNDEHEVELQGTLLALDEATITAYGFILLALANPAALLANLSAAPLNSPAFTGLPTAPTAAPGTSTAQLATTAFVDAVRALLAPLNSPALTGTPTVPTAAPGTNTTQVANTAFVKAAIAALVNASPGTLDTLNELAAALANDPNFATTMTTALAGKQPLHAILTAIAGLAGGANKVPYFTGAATLAMLALGGANGLVQLDGTGRLPAVDGSLLTNLPAAVFSQQYVSSATGLVYASITTFAHGMATLPKLANVEFVCVTAEGGYSTGDVVICGNMTNGANSSSIYLGGWSLFKDATNIKFSALNNVVAMTKAGTAMFNMTAANWNVRVRAFA